MITGGVKRPNASARHIAMEYGSSPVEQPRTRRVMAGRLRACACSASTRK